MPVGTAAMDNREHTQMNSSVRLDHKWADTAPARNSDRNFRADSQPGTAQQAYSPAAHASALSEVYAILRRAAARARGEGVRDG